MTVSLFKLTVIFIIPNPLLIKSQGVLIHFLLITLFISGY